MEMKILKNHTPLVYIQWPPFAETEVLRGGGTLPENIFDMQDIRSCKSLVLQAWLNFVGPDIRGQFSI